MTLLFLVSFAYAFTANGEDIVSEYEGPRLKRGKNWEEGIEMCNASHMTEFFTATKRIIPLDVLQKAIAEAMRKEYCLGFTDLEIKMEIINLIVLALFGMEVKESIYETNVKNSGKFLKKIIKIGCIKKYQTKLTKLMTWRTSYNGRKTCMSCMRKPGMRLRPGKL